MEKKPNVKFIGIKKMLTRDQMKSVVGGYGGSGSKADCNYYPSCPGGCERDGYCSTCCVA